MTASLELTESKLSQHFQKVEALLRQNFVKDLSLDIAWTQNPVAAGLGARGCEPTERNRGGRVFVVPAWKIDKSKKAWLGFREEWAIAAPAGATKRFSFKSINLTIHFGAVGEAIKPQMFRAEWAGYAKWIGDNYSFQAGNAGHPHWQFDALDSFSEKQPALVAQQYADAIRENDSPKSAVEFLPKTDLKSEVDYLKTARKLSRIHFASAAMWWKQPDHSHSPENAKEIEVWLSSLIAYLSEELERLN